MVYAFEINGLPVRTGDLICTTDGGGSGLAGLFWSIVGKLIPGDVDHIAIYVGPEGRCVEAGAKGRVITFDMKGNAWDPMEMKDRRGLLDTLYGIAYPVAGRNISGERESEIREGVARYCLAQAAVEKPYNINFFDPKTEKAFYCSQLAYKAYMQFDIDLNSEIGAPPILGTAAIVFPQEIWGGCVNRRPKKAHRVKNRIKRLIRRQQ
jgi:hypothetical protein